MEIAIWSSKQVARMCGIEVANFKNMVGRGIIPAPPKGPGGAYMWQAEDVARAVEIVRKRCRKIRPAAALSEENTPLAEKLRELLDDEDLRVQKLAAADILESHGKRVEADKPPAARRDRSAAHESEAVTMKKLN